jgi:AraC-like DNA-binding protein
LQLRRAAEKRLRAGECTNVTELAQSLGFGNPGRFAAEFRQRFGVLPSQVVAANVN